MISVLLQKEFIEHRRDGRVTGLLVLVGLLVLTSLIAGWSAYTKHESLTTQAQQRDQAVFVSQGEKSSHSAAHFGRMAYKPEPPLSVFDPGATPYLGQVIWLEAHKRDPAMFRPAEDMPDLRRLADLSVAGVLVLLLPLLIFVAGYASFAGERERGSLRQIMSSGVEIKRLFIAKFVATASVGLITSIMAILVSLLFALTTSGKFTTGDTLARGAGLIFGYGLYCVAFTAVTLFVSALARSATSALFILLSIWAITSILLPQVAASVAKRTYPVPSSSDFWAETSAAIRASRPEYKSEEYRLAELKVLSKASGRAVTLEEASEMNLNRVGLRLAVFEMLGSATYRKAYKNLYETYHNQRRLRLSFSLFSPAIALQHLSSALAGTDISAHEHFASEAEQQRNLIIQKVNEDMMLNGPGEGFSYLASSELWASIPDFNYQPAPTSEAFFSSIWDLLVLGLWVLFPFMFARRIATKQKII